MPDLFDIDSGALGIEALWTWNGLLLTDREAAEYFDLSKVKGLLSGPEHEDPRSKKVGRIGENFYPASPGGKTVVLEGQLRALTLPGMRAFGHTLRAALATPSAEGTMTIAPHADLGGPTGQFTARPITPEMDDVQETVRWMRKPVLGFRLSDPRIYFPALAVDETGNPAAVTNIGSAPADPVITIAGPDRTGAINGPMSVSDGTRTLAFLNVPPGTMVIDFGARTAKIGSTNIEINVAASDWWDSHVEGIAAGATVAIAAANATAVRVQFTPAVW